MTESGKTWVVVKAFDPGTPPHATGCRRYLAVSECKIQNTPDHRHTEHAVRATRAAEARTIDHAHLPQRKSWQNAFAPSKLLMGQLANTVTDATMPNLSKYDTIRDAILTCARKPTWVSLIYRTETSSQPNQHSNAAVVWNRSNLCGDVAI